MQGTITIMAMPMTITMVTSTITSMIRMVR
jgi:hypothetical protein